jgi:hypothetical protein
MVSPERGQAMKASYRSKKAKNKQGNESNIGGNDNHASPCFFFLIPPLPVLTIHSRTPMRKVPSSVGEVTFSFLVVATSSMASI